MAVEMENADIRHRGKMKIPGENMGYHCYFLDTEKNVMGAWSMT